MPTVPLVKPSTVPTPFAVSGGKNTIPTTPGPTAGLASLTLGFPPLTRTPLTSGGLPPSGLDMNGILNLLSQHVAWLNSGGQYTFDATLVAYTGGYMKGMVLQSNDGASSYVSLVDNNTTDFNTTPSSIGTLWGAFGGKVTATDDAYLLYIGNTF